MNTGEWMVMRILPISAIWYKVGGVVFLLVVFLLGIGWTCVMRGDKWAPGAKAAYAAATLLAMLGQLACMVSV